MEEELHFRRHQRYRLQTFAEADREVYSNPAYMSRYVNGILISQLFWRNHAQALDLFRTAFLPRLPDRFNHLEVGPGHGLFLSYAALDSRCKAATGWDVSSSSVHATRHALEIFGIRRPIDLTVQNVLEAPAQREQFDSAIISEVLEHLEQPRKALETLFASLRPGGMIFINVPINSPAPDHIYLWTTPEAVAQLIHEAGFDIETFYELPMTGFTLERARRTRAGISCVAFARKP
ncbi:MAG TPA: class I SAM-dependent methyltransferase [Alphaproteobacteria bacterium]|nr:class I SAM-dependent methyltransferase [Alphaproteobacteria bacterium]